MKRDLRMIIDKCVAFLSSGTDNGQLLLTEVSSNSNMTNSYQTLSVYIPSYIAHCVSFLEQSELKDKIVLKLHNFFIENMEEGGVWRFHGKNQEFPPPDFDDTCCVIACLKKNNLPINSNALELLPKYRSQNGLYYTWIDDNMNKMGFLHTDGGVNTNILFCNALVLNKKIKEIIEQIEAYSAIDEFYRFSIYSVSDYSVIYMITRAFRDGKVNELDSSIKNIVKFLIQKQKDNGSWGNDLDSALALAALVNAKHSSIEVERGLEYLIGKQNSGELESNAFFKAFTPAYYGSSYLTTAIFLESLIKLNNHI